LDIFSKNREAALKTYKNFMDENELEKINVFENVDVIGKVNTKQLDEYLNSDVKTLDQILREIAGDEKIFKAIKNGSRKRHLRIYKKEYVGEAMEFNYTMKEIGECISISDAAVFKIINAD
jgi:putative transposase